MRLLSPVVKRTGSRDDLLPAIDEYNRIRDWYEQLKPNDPTRIAMLGTQALVDAPLDYWITAFQQKVGIEAFNTLPVDIQAKHIAYLQLADMIKLIEEHGRRQEAAKGENKKPKPANKK